MQWVKIKVNENDVMVPRTYWSFDWDIVEEKYSHRLVMKHETGRHRSVCYLSDSKILAGEKKMEGVELLQKDYIDLRNGDKE